MAAMMGKHSSLFFSSSARMGILLPDQDAFILVHGTSVVNA
jgi:hypothetical protein